VSTKRWLFDFFVEDRVGVFHTVDEHANAQAGGKKGTEQEKAVRSLSPGEKKQKRDGHQKFDVHGVFVHPFVLHPGILFCISAFFFKP
jgi:hypothetical protein